MSRRILEDAARLDTADENVLTQQAMTEFAAGAYGPAIEFAARLLESNPNHTGARQTFEKAAKLVGMVGPPDRAVSVEEVRRYVASTQPLDCALDLN